MKKKEIKELKNLINNVVDLEDKRKICQKFSDIGNCGINFKIVDELSVEKSFLQIKEMVMCLK